MRKLPSSAVCLFVLCLKENRMPCKTSIKKQNAMTCKHGFLLSCEPHGNILYTIIFHTWSMWSCVLFSGEYIWQIFFYKAFQYLERGLCFISPVHEWADLFLCDLASWFVRKGTVCVCVCVAGFDVTSHSRQLDVIAAQHRAVHKAGRQWYS